MKKKCLIFSLMSATAVLSADVHFELNEPAVKFAAKDMARCLSKVTGKEVKSIQGKSEGIVGDVILKVKPGLQREEWEFQSKDGKVYIYGRDGHGIVYGVYTFLEEYADCGWLAPDTEILPENKKWKLPENLNEKGKPVFSRREMYVGYDYMDGIWRLRNKESNRANYGIGVRSGSPRDCHTFDVYVKALENRPELFGLSVNGNKCNTLCMTNPEVRKIILAELIKYIEKDRKAYAGKPDYMCPVIYDISQPDGGSGGECWCDGCRKLAEEEGAYSGPNIAFVNYLADAIKDKYPEVVLRTFAYSYTMKPPKKINASDNVVVQFCDAKFYKPLLKGTPNGNDLEKWGAHAKNKAIWSYWRIFTGELYPFVKKRSDMAGEIRFCRDQGVIHYFAEDEEPLSRSFAMMQHWVMLKLLENPDRDINALVKRFMEGYYGKAAPVMQEYLIYLEKRQESTKAFLDREFFEKVNFWLDKAEDLTAGNALARSHVNWERVIVDRAMFINLAKLIKSGYKYDKEKVLKRFGVNSQEIIRNWKSLPKRLLPERLKNAEMEAELFSHFPVTVPKQFDGCEVIDWHWNQITKVGKAEYVKDPDAVCGTAFKNPNFKHRLPFSLGHYFPPNKRGGALTFSAVDIPQDEKFHLYNLGKNVVMQRLYVYFDNSWTFRSYLPTIGIIPTEWDIWVSMKFTGPAYVKGSKSPNAVLFDRMFLVKDPAPMRHYKPVDTSKNLLKNGGFEKHSAKWIDGWGRPNANCNVDKTVKHSGEYSLKVGNVPKTYTNLSAALGKIEDLKNDLLIRGWYKTENLENVKGYNLPFIGIWTSTEKKKNSYTLPVATLYPGSYEWTRFEMVLKADELKEKVKRYPADQRPHTMAFRINLYHQPGTIWLDDVEVLPLEKK